MCVSLLFGWSEGYRMSKTNVPLKVWTLPCIRDSVAGTKSSISGLISEQSVWDLWLKKCYWHRFLSDSVCLSVCLSISLHQRPIPILNLLLFSSERNGGEVRKHQNTRHDGSTGCNTRSNCALAFKISRLSNRQEQEFICYTSHCWGILQMLLFNWIFQFNMYLLTCRINSTDAYWK
jgi:hypothetical protein